MSIKQLEKTLKLDIKAALGCTEPIAIALGACKAKSLVSGDLRQIILKLSTNLIKNALEVGIPNTGGQHGIALAAALGALIKSKTADLTLLENLDEQILADAKAIVKKGIVSIEPATNRHGLYMDIIVTDDKNNTGRCIISGTHENIILLEQNKTVVFASGSEEQTNSGDLLKKEKL